MRNGPRTRIVSFAGSALLLLVLASCGQCAAPEEVLLKMLDTYAGCTSLRVHGIARSEQSFVSTGTFQLDFARPEYYRYEYISRAAIPLSLLFGDRVGKLVIWSDGQKSFSWAKDKVTNEPSFQSVATRTYEGPCSLLFRLLTGDHSGGLNPASLRNLQNVGNEEIDGVQCTRIKGEWGKIPGRAGAVLWIDPKSLMLARLETAVVSDWNPITGKREHATFRHSYTFESRLNPTIPTSVFSLEGH